MDAVHARKMSFGSSLRSWYLRTKWWTTPFNLSKNHGCKTVFVLMLAGMLTACAFLQ